MSECGDDNPDDEKREAVRDYTKSVRGELTIAVLYKRIERVVLHGRGNLSFLFGPLGR
jgi:hypothetical protein